MEPAGGAIVSERLDELEAALRDYFGALNEVNMGLKVRKMPPKPKAFVQYERCKTLGIPLVEGGVMNQPYLWLQELAVIIEEETLFIFLEKQSGMTSGAP